MPGPLTEEEQAEQDRLEAEEKAKADEEARKAAEAKEKEDRGDDFTPADDEEKELDAEALAKIAAEEEDPEAKKKAEDAAAAKKKEEDDAAAKKAAEGKEPEGIDDIDKKIKVPKWRLDQEADKRRQTERENEELKTRLAAIEKGQQPSAQPKAEEKPKEEPKGYDFDEAEQRYADALIEGNKKVAAEIRAEIRTEEDKARQSKQDEQNTATATRQAIEAEAGTIATKMFKEYPFFDSTSDKANKRAIGVLLAVRDQAFRAGVPFPQAVQQAFDEVGPMYAHLMEKPVDDKDKGKKTPEQIEADKKKLADDEKKKAAEAAGQQPPDLKGGSQQAGKKINAATLTDEEFDALPEPEKARLRGDNA